jgi:uncharacterized phosphosugar-binding protein
MTNQTDRRWQRYSEVALPHLERQLSANEAVFQEISAHLLKEVPQGGKLFVFGSGHSASLAFEVYHRAGGPSFVIPVVGDFLLPSAGPPVVRVLERTPGVAQALLDRAGPRPGEMLWLASQSGINGAVVDLALNAKARGLRTIAWTSRAHSQSLPSRHPSGKRLFEVCDGVVDLGGVAGDSAIPLNDRVSAGPLSTLTSVFLAHSLLVEVCGQLEAQGFPCVYTSVNTAEGEKRNREIEAKAAERDPLLR